MFIDVRRKSCLADRTLSDIFIDSQFFCYGLEDTVREVKGRPVEEWKKFGCTAIPEGTYKVVIDWSNRFKRQMIQILDVPGYSGVRIHNGKGPESTDGCLLVSTTLDFNYDKTAMHDVEKKVMEALVRKEDAVIKFAREGI